MILDRLSELEMVVLIFELIINVTLSVPLCLYVSHYVIISLKKIPNKKILFVVQSWYKKRANYLQIKLYKQKNKSS